MADKKQQAPDVPVYLFTGFLEAGKTKFIQETLEDSRFHKGERTLLLLCEDGEEVYEPDRFCAGNVYVRNIDEESELTRDYLLALQDELHPERVLVEYNGMWMLDSLYGSLPENWAVAQEFLFCDATTFVSYNANMRQLTVDKLKSTELVVLNRFQDSMDRMEMHRIIRAISRRCDIAYEYTDGKVVYDDIEDPLPFDVDAPVIEIEDRDYALWYRDMSEAPKKYDGKTVEVKCRCLVRKNVPKGCFIAGRHIRTRTGKNSPEMRSPALRLSAVSARFFLADCQKYNLLLQCFRQCSQHMQHPVQPLGAERRTYLNQQNGVFRDMEFCPDLLPEFLPAICIRKPKIIRDSRRQQTETLFRRMINLLIYPFLILDQIQDHGPGIFPEHRLFQPLKHPVARSKQTYQTAFSA